MVRVMLTRTTSAQVVYAGFRSWARCQRWIKRLSSNLMREDELAMVRKRLRRKRLATTNEVRASVQDIESLGLYRIDNSEKII
jgi:hypothetical protein